jgi:hypothetical protein
LAGKWNEKKFAFSATPAVYPNKWINWNAGIGKTGRYGNNALNRLENAQKKC